MTKRTQITKSNKPLRCLITDGFATGYNFDTSKKQILKQVSLASDFGLSIVQIREKQLPTRLLQALVGESVALLKGTAILVLVNDRFDVALAARADGVHLTSESLNACRVRSICPPDFVIGVSTHSFEEAAAAKADDADFVLFGPVFDTPSKRQYGKPKGIEELISVCRRLKDFPVLAVGGVNSARTESILSGGAAGFAAIRMYDGSE